MGYDPQNSHYLNQKNRIIHKDPYVSWVDWDANYNIKTGLTFGESEEQTLKKQNWTEQGG